MKIEIKILEQTNWMCPSQLNRITNLIKDISKETNEDHLIIVGMEGFYMTGADELFGKKIEDKHRLDLN